MLGAALAQLSFLPPAEDVAVAAGEHRSRSNAMAFVAGSVAVTVVLFGVAAVCASVTTPTAQPEAPAVPIRLDDRAAQLATGAAPAGTAGAGARPPGTPAGATPTAAQPEFYFFGATGPVRVRVLPVVPGSGAAPAFVVSDVINAGTTGGASTGGGLPPALPPGGGPALPPVTPAPVPDPPVVQPPPLATQTPTPEPPPVTPDPTPEPPPPVTPDPTPEPPAPEPTPEPPPPVTPGPTPEPPPVDPSPADPDGPLVEIGIDILGTEVGISL